MRSGQSIVAESTSYEEMEAEPIDATQGSVVGSGVPDGTMMLDDAHKQRDGYNLRQMERVSLAAAHGYKLGGHAAWTLGDLDSQAFRRFWSSGSVL